MIDQCVGALGQGNGGLGDPPSLAVFMAARKQPRPESPPSDRRLQSVARESLTLQTQFVGLGVSVERETCATQQRSSLGGVGVEAHAAKAVVGLTEMRLCGSRVVDDQLDNAGKLLNFQKGMAQAEFGDRTPRRVDHPSGRLGASPEGLQHRLAPRRCRFDRRRVGRDSQEPHHIKTPPARTRDRVGAPERGKWRAGQHRVDPAVITRAPGCRQGVVQRDFAVADSAEAGEARGPNGMGVGFACGIV